MDTNNPNKHIDCPNCGETINANLLKYDKTRGVTYCEYCDDAYWQEVHEAEDYLHL